MVCKVRPDQINLLLLGFAGRIFLSNREKKEGSKVEFNAHAQLCIPCDLENGRDFWARHSPFTDLPTVPGFPGLSRELSCPGVPETYRMSRDRLPTGFVSRHPFRYMISILETLQRWTSEGSHTRYCAICRIFFNLTFELQ